jgi:hypothetical protein
MVRCVCANQFDICKYGRPAFRSSRSTGGLEFHRTRKRFLYDTPGACGVTQHVSQLGFSVGAACLDLAGVVPMPEPAALRLAQGSTCRVVTPQHLLLVRLIQAVVAIEER